MIEAAISLACGIAAAIAAHRGAQRFYRHRRALRMAGRLGLPAPTPPTEPTAGEVVLWMIDPSRSDPRRGGK